MYICIFIFYLCFNYFDDFKYMMKEMKFYKYMNEKNK